MILETNNIQFQYNGSENFVLEDLALSKGDELLILGKSGSGKTTILSILGGLLPPKQGEVIVNGVALYQLKSSDLDKFRGENIGIVFQKPHLLKPLNVEENIKLVSLFADKKTLNKSEELLAELGISGKRRSMVFELSEGEAQRVSIARALANTPKLILADEPTASLDDENARAVIQLLQKQSKKLHAALIIVTHDQRVKALIRQQIIMGGKE